MPHDDMSFFMVLAPGAVAQGTGTTAATRSSWPDAVAQLWLTKLPRVITTSDGGVSFQVIGGEHLELVRPATDVTDDAPRLEVYRYKGDIDVPPIPANHRWVGASPTAGYETQPFYCSLVSGHKNFHGYVGYGWLHYAVGDERGVSQTPTPATWQDTTVRIEVTSDMESSSPGTVATMKTFGKVSIRMRAPGGQVTPLTVHRCLGETVLRPIIAGWSAMAYGWVLQEGWVGSAEKVLCSVYDVAKEPITIGNATAHSRGCFSDSGFAVIKQAELRSPHLPRTYKNCVREAAKAGYNLCGMTSGSTCWVPNTRNLTIETIAERRERVTGTACQNGGSGTSMHVYTVDEPERLKLTTLSVPNQTVPHSFTPIQDRGCWNVGTGLGHVMPGGGEIVADYVYCGYTAAYYGRKVFGMANGACWIPVAGETAEVIAARSPFPLDEECGRDGMPGGVHLYSANDDQYRVLKTPVLFNNPITITGAPVWGPGTVVSRGCFNDRPEGIIRRFYNPWANYNVHSCGRTAAFYGKNVFGLKGGYCFVPQDPQTAEEAAALANNPIVAQTCPAIGTETQIHLYSIDDANKALIGR
jgi:hypothetical protein